MSLKTWKAEFYPVPAEEATATDVEACEHSLRKWRGALPENLAKHGVKYEGGILFRDEVFEFGSDECSLCRRNDGCANCPIVKCGERPCWMTGSAFDISEKDPTPMIATLEKALAWAKAQEAEQ